MKNRTVLLVWEMGAGLGHIRRLLVVAEALRQRGWQPVIAQRTIHTLADEVRAAGFPMLPVPPMVSLAPRDQPFRALTYADIMAISGYARMDVLEPLLDAWDGLLRYVDPALVIGDYCPILPMAARGRYRFLAFGDGFVVPPHEPEAFPPLREVGQAIHPVARMTEEVNGLLAKRGQPVIERLGQLVAGDAQVVTTLPELDVYHAYRSQPASGPLDEPPPPRALPEAPRLFVYLAADFANTRKVLQAVVNAGVPAEAFIRDANVKLREQLRQAGMIVHDTPPPLAERLNQASVVLHHGGMGTLETALAMGCAQLLAPRHLEQTLNARNLQRRQIAGLLDPNDIGSSREIIARGLADRDWQRRMGDLARRLDSRRPLSSLQHMVEAVEQLAAG